ncbi:MAG TPA: hypothetical protein PKO38_04430, partial [Bacillota bacterium]|nr:hypothetical protein [Bacillota bacterium]
MSRLICQRRIAWLLLLLSCIFLFLVGKLVKIQLFRSAELTELAVQQRAQGLTVLSGRGDIQDRYGRSLLDRDRWVGLAAFPAQYSGREKEIAEQYAAVPGIERIFPPPLDLSPFWINLCVEQYLLPELSDGIPGIVSYPEACRYGPGLLAS